MEEKPQATTTPADVVRYCPINHHDTRGIIRDIFPDGAPPSVTLITMRAGTVRGNHMHRASVQHLYVVSGGIVAYHTAPYNMRKLAAVGMGAGALITHEPGVAHAYRAIVDSILIAFASGVRMGEDYRKDTWAVGSLIELWDQQQADAAGALGEAQYLPLMRVVGDPW